MSQACILVLMGLPGSGKSTLAQNLERALVSSLDTTADLNIVHVCYDQIMPAEKEEQLIEGSLKEAWKIFRRHILEEVGHLVMLHIGRDVHLMDTDGYTDIIPDNTELMEQKSLVDKSSDPYVFYKDIRTALKDIVDSSNAIIGQGRIVFVIDDNMYYRSMRYGYYQLARQLEIGFAQVHVQCTVDTALAQNGGRERPVAEGTITEMAQRIELPRDESWEGTSLTWKKEYGLEPIMALIGDALRNPVQDHVAEAAILTQESRIACARSQLHQVDNVLRRLVSETMQAAKANSQTQELQKIAKRANECRSEVMADVKAGQLKFDSDTDWLSAAQDSDSDRYRTVWEAFQSKMSIQP